MADNLIDIEYKSLVIKSYIIFKWQSILAYHASSMTLR